MTFMIKIIEEFDSGQDSSFDNNSMLNIKPKKMKNVRKTCRAKLYDSDMFDFTDQNDMRFKETFKASHMKKNRSDNKKTMLESNYPDISHLANEILHRGE